MSGNVQCAQESSATDTSAVTVPQAAPTLKIGYVDVMKVADSYQKTKDIREDIEKTRETKESQIKDKLKDLRKLRDEVELMGLESKQNKREEFSDKVKELEEYQRQANLELRKEKDAQATEILKEIEDAVKAYGKENGYAMLMRSGAVIYRDDSLDVTDTIIDILNKRYAKEKKK
jgi:outer membrane protein